MPKARDFWRLLRDGGFKGRGHPERAAPDVPRAAAPLPLPALEAGEASLTWIGHATYLVRIATAQAARPFSILTDPNYTGHLPGRIKRLVPPGIPFADLPPIDAVVVSHNHYDHLDKATMRRLARDHPEAAAFVPLGVGPFMRRRGVATVHELDWWQSATHGPARITCVPVHHWSGRFGIDNNRTLWGGWVIEAAGKRLYFGGDTAYGGRFKETAARFGPFDVAMLPIGAYAPRWFMQGVHMDPDEAVAAAQDLRAQRLASMHWGTFVLTQEPLLEPLERVRAAWVASGRPREDLWDLAVGETRVLRDLRDLPDPRVTAAAGVAA